MLEGKKIIVVLPAYNAEKTLKRTYDDIPKDIVDEIILVDDHSRDDTIKVAKKLGIKCFVHEVNLGYGGNQKTCYREALKLGADIVIMLHPDYQYPPKLITAMAAQISCGMFDIVLGSRILAGYAMKGGMPIYKYISNRILTFLENIVLFQKISEYHTGYRAYSREVLLDLPLLENSHDFIFDNQLITQAVFKNYRIGEISTPCNYNEDCSSINFKRSCIYGLGVLWNALNYRLQKLGWVKLAMYDFKNGKKIVI